jgi:hypothetical protein
LNYIASSVDSEVESNKHFSCFQHHFTGVQSRVRGRKPPQNPDSKGISKIGMETRLELQMVMYVLWYWLDSFSVFYKSCVYG